MLDKQTITTFRSARLSLILGLIGLVLVLFPIIGGSLSALSFLLVFSVIPLTGTILGIVAVVLYVKARKKFNELESEFGQTRSFLANRAIAKAGLLSGSVSVLIGIFTLSVFIYHVQLMKPAANEPVGIAEVYYYGDEQYNETGFQTVLLPDSTLITIGTRVNRHRTDVNNGSDAILLKTDLNGVQISYKVIPDADGRCLIVTDKQSLLICLKPDRLSTENDKKGSLWIYETTLGGDSLGSRFYLPGQTIHLNGIIPTKDGNYIILGEIPVDSVKGYTPFLMKIDSSADTLWIKFYPKLLAGIYDSIIETEDGGFLCSGYYINEYEARYELRLLRTDHNGELLWDSRGRNTISVGGVKSVEAGDGSIFMLGNCWDSSINPGGCMLKLDDKGWLDWNKPFELNRYNLEVEMADIAPWVGGDWLAVGRTVYSKSSMRIGSQKTESWTTYYLSRISPDGDLRHAFHGSETDLLVWRMLPVGDSLCVVTGSGGKGAKDRFGRLRDTDIGLLYYRAG